MKRGSQTNDTVESRRILDRVAQEADSGTPSLLSSATRRVGDHVSAADTDRSDPIEYWGTRIGRTLGLIISVVLIVGLVIFVAKGWVATMAAEDNDPPRAVIVISSHVARGSVGNRAAVFALETLGYPVWAVPTVILPWHPGHGAATRIVPDPKQFASLMKDLERAPWLGEVAGVLSGYLGDAEQAAAVASLVGAVRARNRNAIYICDPVMGDSGGLYVSQALAEALRDVLVPIADIATPNRFELEWMSGSKLDDMRAVMGAALYAGPPTMLVTSAPAMMAGGTGNLLLTPSVALLAEHRLIERPPNGLGDLTAAVFLARLLEGQPSAKALQSTTASVFEILARTAKRGGDELQLETDAQSLSHPMAMVQLRHLTHPGRDRRA